MYSTFIYCLQLMVLPSFARPRCFTTLFVLLGPLLTVTNFFLKVSVKVWAVFFFMLRLGLSVHIKHMFSLLHLLQELIHSLRVHIQTEIDDIKGSDLKPSYRRFLDETATVSVALALIIHHPLGYFSVVFLTCSGFQLVKEKSCSDGQMELFSCERCSPPGRDKAQKG